jgi:uncharacterized protein
MNIAAPKANFFDNIIPFKKGIYEEQTAGWQPGSAATRGLGCKIIADQMIPVADGISLAGDVFLPKKPARYPAILVFGAYTKELHAAGIPAGTNEVGSPPVFTDRGYAHVIVTRRGMGRSEGETGLFFNEQDVDDHVALIGWVAAQPWCDGQVVLFGISYFGCTQPQVAVRNPPALKGFFCDEVCTDYFRHITAFGGTPAVYFLNLWTGANFTQSIIDMRIAPAVRAMLSWVFNTPLKRLWWPLMQKRLPAIQDGFMTKTPVREVRDQIANWLFDGKTRATNAIGTGPYAELDKIDVPFVAVQNLGQFNLHQFGNYDLFLHASTLADRKWLILGKPTYELPVFGWQMEALAFFDHITRGTANGYAEQAPVRYWLDGPDHYASARSFPPPQARKLRLFLTSGGEDAATHMLSDTVPEGGHNRWAAVPRGAPMVGGMDQVVNQTLTYDMPVQQPTELTGAIMANLKFSANEIDSYVLARLGRVDALGGYHLLSLGAISPARRKVDAARSSDTEIAIDIDTPEPLTPGEPVILSFSLTPGPMKLMPGETLRLEIASRTDLLLSDVAHDHCHFEMEVPPYFSRNTLHYGADSWIEVAAIVQTEPPE